VRFDLCCRRVGFSAGPSGGLKFNKGVDANGRVAKVNILCSSGVFSAVCTGEVVVDMNVAFYLLKIMLWTSHNSCKLWLFWGVITQLVF